MLVLFQQDNLSNPPTPPASLPPTPPPLARQKMVNGFATTEELATKAVVMGERRHSGPESHVCFGWCFYTSLFHNSLRNHSYSLPPPTFTDFTKEYQPPSRFTREVLITEAGWADPSLQCIVVTDVTPTVTKGLGPRNFQAPFRPEDELLVRAIAQGPKTVDVPASLPTPPHNNHEELR